MLRAAYNHNQKNAIITKKIGGIVGDYSIVGFADIAVDISKRTVSPGIRSCDTIITINNNFNK